MAVGTDGTGPAGEGAAASREGGAPSEDSEDSGGVSQARSWSLCPRGGPRDGRGGPKSPYANTTAPVDGGGGGEARMHWAPVN